MRRTEPAPWRDACAAAARWHASVMRAYLRLAGRSVGDYAHIQCRVHWKTWSLHR
jgi:hypothetical protein